MLSTNILLILSFSKVQLDRDSYSEFVGVSHNCYLTYFYPFDFKLSVSFNVLFANEA